MLRFLSIFLPSSINLICLIWFNMMNWKEKVNFASHWTLKDIKYRAMWLCNLQHSGKPMKLYSFKLQNESYFRGGSPLVCFDLLLLAESLKALPVQWCRNAIKIQFEKMKVFDLEAWYWLLSSEDCLGSDCARTRALHVCVSARVCVWGCLRERKRTRSKSKATWKAQFLHAKHLLHPDYILFICSFITVNISVLLTVRTNHFLWTKLWTCKDCLYNIRQDKFAAS